MHDADRPRQLPGFQIQLLDGEAVLFHPNSRKIAHLNCSATLIWQLCDGQRTVADICHLLATAYPDAVTEIRADVSNTLSLVQEHGALELVGEDTDDQSAG